MNRRGFVGSLLAGFAALRAKPAKQPVKTHHGTYRANWVEVKGTAGQDIRQGDYVYLDNTGLLVLANHYTHILGYAMESAPRGGQATVCVYGRA